MAINRRQVLRGSAALLTASLGGIGPVAAATSPAVAFLDKSKLIYLSPLQSGGAESKCHGEVWFVHHADEIYVVTRSDAWRAEALRRGLRRAAIWIGEFGVWKRAKDRYRSAPYLVIEGRFEENAAAQTAILERYAEKYADEWGSWGPRFHKGLTEGSRVMLRYVVTG
ncbi:MAG: hypothetical protein ACU85U_22930 [Gammaproteobacteria bacterium]|jgi:hypothetical protein